MRKLIAIALLAVFGLPFATSLFALTPKSEANLPACCRRNGKHHCMMSMAERAQMASDKPQFSAPLEKCPYAPAALVFGHQTKVFAVPQGQVTFTGMTGLAAVFARAESNRRVSRDRSRQMRGPPSVILL